MAILIPSKKIYGDIENPKVAENAIKKMEVVENDVSIISTDKDIDHLKSVLSGGTTAEFDDVNKSKRIFPTTNTQKMFSAGLKTRMGVCTTSLELDRFVKDYYITQINPTIEIDFDVTISKVKATSYIGALPDIGAPRFVFGDTADTLTSRSAISSSYFYENSNVSYSKKDTFKLQDDLTISPTLIKCEFSVIDDSASEENRLTSFITLSTRFTTSALHDEGKMPYTIETLYFDNKINANIKYINKFAVWFAQDYASAENKDAKISTRVEATKIEFVAREARLVYNETIKYLSEKDYTQVLTNENGLGEEVLSVSKNSFLRKNFKYGNVLGTPALLYDKTLEMYKSGKEYAVLRCSIGEYLDENGNLVVSTKTPDKMLFEHYDKVVPMVRNGEGIDLAMSYTADGLAKVFDVVGVRVFFDGAVWQELTLRESGEGIDIGRTTYTTIPNKARGLTYKITSNEIVTEENSARGITYIIGD